MKQFSKAEAWVIGIYLFIVFLFWWDAMHCSGFMCGVSLIIPIIPILLLFSTIGINTSSWWDTSIANSYLYFIMCVLLQALIIHGLFMLVRYLKVTKSPKPDLSRK